ncbi:N-acetylmuramoyl-L-alanine amidase [Caldanaerobacter sp.]|uniref:N-acetylmuramoyl-L-alanine amidase n=1 Tax=Caldanaerobacter sp. TaxID=2930036 RepID=UPI003C72BF30
MAYRIFIDPGHGGKDSGAVGNGLKEKDLTLEISKMIRQYLLDNYTNIEVRLSREFDAFLDLADRAEKANTWGADIFVSVHINSGGGTGFESFIHINANTDAVKLQGHIHNEVIKATAFTNRGMKRANFAVLRLSKMPAILTENGFIDNINDANKLKNKDFLQAIAVAHAEGIAKYFGLQKKEEKIMGKLFKDVPDNHWAIKDIEWAKNVGLMKGYDDGTFGLGKNITREELAVVLHRLYEKFIGGNK